MRRIVLVTCVIAVAAALNAQQLTEKLDVNLVNVDVTVTSHGKPARGLTRDDFEVLEDGVPQTITNFYAIEGTRAKPAAVPALQAEAPISAPSEEERFRRKVLVIIDNRHTSRHNRDVALQKLEEFINDRFASGTYDWSIAMISDRAYLILPLTSDKDRIHQALATVRDAMAERTMREIAATDARLVQTVETADRPIGSDGIGAATALTTTPNGTTIYSDAAGINPNSSSGALIKRMFETGKRFEQAADVGITYNSIRDVTRSFANSPGRKMLLLLTGNFSDEENPLGAVEQAEASRHTARLTSLRERLIREANASNASLYIIDTEGLKTLNASSDLDQYQSNAAVFGDFAGSRSTVGGPLYWIARNTGGRFFNGNFVDRSLRDFDTGSSDFYSLAYRPNHPIDGKYHTITVRLKNPGRESLVYRQGYSAVSVDRQLARAMTSTMAAEMQPSTMPVTMLLGSASAPDGQGGVIVPIQAAVPSSALLFVPVKQGLVAHVDFYVSVFDARGHIVTTFHSVREARANEDTENSGNFVESEKMRLRKGVPYRVVVAMHDQVSDAVGITSQDVKF
jgi:VWFA-related protein